MLLILAGLVLTASALPPDESADFSRPAHFSLPVKGVTAITVPVSNSQATAARAVSNTDSEPAVTAATVAHTAPARTGSAASPSDAEPMPVDVTALAPEPPLRIIIPAIKLDAPIKPVELVVSKDGRSAEWTVPAGRASGWHDTTPRLGEPGNMVLNGHHNIRGRVFARVKDLEPLDQIILIGERRKVTYEIVERKLLLERGQPMSVRIENAQWIQPTEDTRLTLVTCWPPTDNSHRLIVIARPVAEVLLETETGKD